MTGLLVVIPTVGRASVCTAILSVASQLGPHDALFVVWDAPPGQAEDELRRTLVTINGIGQCAILGTDGPSRGGFGHPARNWLLNDRDLLPYHTTHVWSLDDDDIALPGALDAIRHAADHYLHHWFAFQMLFGPNSHAAGHTVWREPKVELGNIGTPCIVMPVTAKSRWGALGVDPRTGRYFGAGYFGDYQIARDLEAELGPPVWVPRVVCEVRPAIESQP